MTARVLRRTPHGFHERLVSADELRRILETGRDPSGEPIKDVMLWCESACAPPQPRRGMDRAPLVAPTAPE